MLAATLASLQANLGTEAAPGFPCTLSFGMVAWLRSSSQDPMVAARLANRPLLPSGVPEDAGRAATGAASACLFIKEMGVQSGAASEVPVTVSKIIS